MINKILFSFFAITLFTACASQSQKGDRSSSPVSSEDVTTLHTPCYLPVEHPEFFEKNGELSESFVVQQASELAKELGVSQYNWKTQDCSYAGLEEGRRIRIETTPNGRRHPATH